MDKEEKLEAKLDEIAKKQEEFLKKEEEIKNKELDIETLKSELDNKLSEMSKLTIEEAREMFLKQISTKYEKDALNQIDKYKK
jgi:ribonuclease Y